MGIPLIDLTGRRIGHLTVISEAPRRLLNSGENARFWTCQCDCGTEVEIRTQSLTGERTLSCGCIRLEQVRRAATKHGYATGGPSAMSPEYRAWGEMRQRCNNPSKRGWRNYGGRGIKVCERWDDFENFLSDIGPRPSPQHSLDRYPNNDGDYEPGNVRWASLSDQSRNTRSNHWVTLNGERLILRDWARRIGISERALNKRLNKLTVEEALTRPVMPGGGRARPTDPQSEAPSP